MQSLSNIRTYRRAIIGFTLVQMLFLLAILSSMLLLISNYNAQRSDQFRRDKAALQMQQIFNAAILFYSNNGRWPSWQDDPSVGTSTQCMTTPSVNGTTYFSQSELTNLPSPLASPYGQCQYISWCDSDGNFNLTLSGSYLTPSQVCNLTSTQASTLAGMLPNGEVATGDGTAKPYYGSGPLVHAKIQIPGQNLNNARSINFTGIYNSGACVPMPSCPQDADGIQMVPQIVVVPSSVRGVNDAPQKTDDSACTSSPLYDGTGAQISAGDCSKTNAYAITGYMAIAKGSSTSPTATPPSCDGAQASSPCFSDVAQTGWQPTVSGMSGNFWRVCLQVQTENGAVTIGGTPTVTNFQSPYLYWTQAKGQIIAMTRCVSAHEPKSSSLNVWGK